MDGVGVVSCYYDSAGGVLVQRLRISVVGLENIKPTNIGTRGSCGETCRGLGFGIGPRRAHVTRDHSA